MKLRDSSRTNKSIAIAQAFKRNWRTTNQAGTQILKGTDPLGFPVYFKTLDNIISAATTRTDLVQPGGALNLNLSGSDVLLKSKLAIWDEGIVFAGHQEFNGKEISIGDTCTSVLDHPTHVAGTILANGVNPLVKGMAFGTSTLRSFDFNNDAAEMADIASSLLISNHSYGYEAGWNFNNSQSRWEWLGLPGDSVDYKFGFYSNDARNFDAISFYAPQYLIVQAAGNSHGDTGPQLGGDYFGYRSRTDATLVDKGPRLSLISSNDGFDVISGSAIGKNVLTVGAIYPLPNGPSVSYKAVIAPFSSWGPTDDGRIKPDICGNGVGVLSCGAGSPTAYYISSGTSMSTPNVSGSLLLLQEYFARRNQGKFMRSATLKGLVCHTAFDSGNPGPDYIYGWGVLDMAKAADAISGNGAGSLIIEQTLIQGDSQVYSVTAKGNEPLMATIGWTDPEGTNSTYGVINGRTPKLVNDLDLRIYDDRSKFEPWVLDPDKPNETAIHGDNFRDNIEQVLISFPEAGKNYKIIVTHKSKLKYGLQNFSLIVTGIQSSSYDNRNTLALSMYPIPTMSTLNVSFFDDKRDRLAFVLINSLGQKVYELTKNSEIGANISSISMDSFPSGMYFLKMQLGNSIYYKAIPVVK